MTTPEFGATAKRSGNSIRVRLCQLRLIDTPPSLVAGERKSRILDKIRRMQTEQEKRHEGQLRFLRSLYDPPVDPNQS